MFYCAVANPCNPWFAHPRLRVIGSLFFTHTLLAWLEYQGSNPEPGQIALLFTANKEHVSYAWFVYVNALVFGGF